MSMVVAVAACQTPDVREDVATAVSWIRRFTEEAAAASASIVCFPECFLQGYLTDERAARRQAMGLAGRAFATVLEALSDLQPAIVFGLIESQGDVLFNTAVVVERGRLVGAYRKTRILSGEAFFRAGTESPVFDVAGLRIGLNICADTGVPEPAAAVARQGARVIVCPANNMLPRTDAEAWRERHNPARAARARENGVWVVSADVTGERDGGISYGPTAIINPDGVVVVQVPLMEIGMVVAEIPVVDRVSPPAA